MKTSPRGIVSLMGEEGIVPGPYLDTATPPVWTWGVGHTAAAGAPDPRTMPRGIAGDLGTALGEIFAVFRRDLEKYEAAVLRAIGRTPVEQHEFDAAVSFHYNTGAIGRAAWVDLWKSGRKAEAGRSMLANWRRPASIIERRENEQAMFLHGVYRKTSAPVWGVTSTGRVQFGQPLRVISQANILEMMGEAETPRTPMPIIRLGSRGEAAKILQTALGIPADGIFGPATLAAVIAAQRSHDLKPDGIVGAITWATLIPQTEK